MELLLARLQILEQEVADYGRKWKLVTGDRDTGDLSAKAIYLEILENMFSEDELRTLCFSMGVDYENLPASSKPGKARELLIRVERDGRLNRLYEIVRRERAWMFDEDSGKYLLG